MFLLRVESGPDKGQVVELHEGLNTIGRRPGNEYKSSDAHVSRKHCTITVSRAGACLENHSQYGALVDGTPVTTPVMLKAGMRLQLGHSETALSVSVKDDQVDTDALSADYSDAPPPRANAQKGGKQTVETALLPDSEPDSAFELPPLPRVETSDLPPPEEPPPEMESFWEMPRREPPPREPPPREMPRRETPTPPREPPPREAPRRPEPAPDDRELRSEPDLESGVFMPHVERDAAGDEPHNSGSVWLPPAELKALINKMKPEEALTRQLEAGDIEARCRQEVRSYRLRLMAITWGTVGVGILVALAVILL